jgi:hypothetical protein
MSSSHLCLGNYACHAWTSPEPPSLKPGEPPVAVLRLEAAADRAVIPVLSWDGEGGGRARANLLHQPVHLQAVVCGRTISPADGLAACVCRDPASLRYTVAPAAGIELTWEIASSGGEWTLSFDWRGSHDRGLTTLELVFPFAADTTPTTLVTEHWDDANRLSLPGLLVAPDFGAYAVRAEGAAPRGRLEGQPADKVVRLVIEFPIEGAQERCVLRFTPVVLPVPPGVSPELWTRARRGWFSLYNTTALSYAADGRLCAMAGMLGNNVLSTPVSSCLYSHAETAVLLPRLTPEVHAGPILRRSLEFWLNCETGPDGFVRYYSLSPLADPMDANAGLLIGVWAYVEITGDLDWLTRNLDRIALVARYLAVRDVDGDGLIESRQSGNLGTKDWGDSIYDTISSGHKNAYCNAMAYRAWRALEDLYLRLSRPAQSQHYQGLAERLRAAYLPAFLAPETGWLGWWRSADGVLHDYAALIVNCVAVTSGVVDIDTGRAILGRLWEELERVGFERFDTGVPTCLRPVPRDLQPLDFGGQREDGADTFPRYCNGGVFLQDAQRALAALYLVGERARAESLLHTMLERQHRGGHFANGSGFNAGVTNRMGTGPSIMDWSGNPTCYEGFMTRDAAFLHGVFLRQAAYLDRWPGPAAGERNPG